jgi:hypothetical protein
VRANMASRSVVLPLWNGPTSAMHRGPRGLLTSCPIAVSLVGARPLIGSADGWSPRPGNLASGKNVAAGHCGVHTDPPTYQPSLRAQRSNPFHSGAGGKMDCFVARAPRNDAVGVVVQFQTPDTRPPSRGMTCPRFAFRYPPDRREQGMPDARCIRGLACKLRKGKRTRAYRAVEAIRHSLRNGFTAYDALTPGYRAFMPPSPPGNRHLGPVGLSRLRKT